MAAQAESCEQVAALLDDLAQLGLLSDERAAETLIRARAGRLGRARLARELRRRGIQDEIADRALAAAGLDDFSTARSLWLKRFGVTPTDEREKARQVRFLQGRGFSLAVILRILREPRE